MTTVDFESLLKAEMASFRGSAKILEAVEYSLLSPGKRIRPQMVFAASQAVGLKPILSEPIALALEMVHCFTLIHDDLPCMDNDDFRRGIPTSHKKFGEAIALLAGDALIPMALQTFSRTASHCPPKVFQESLSFFCQMMGPEGVMGGQADEADLLLKPSFEKLIAVFEKKTGALFSAAFALPALMVGTSPPSVIQSLKKMGLEYGIVFQIVDDLEDLHQSNPTAILHYMTFEAAYEDAQKRLQKTASDLNALFPTNSSTQLLQIHALIEKKLHLCRK